MLQLTSIVPLLDARDQACMSVHEFDPGEVFVDDFDAQGKSTRVGEVRSNNSVVYAPGINPLAIRRVEWDPIDYRDVGSRKVRVFVLVLEGSVQYAPETLQFTTREQYEAHWKDAD